MRFQPANPDQTVILIGGKHPGFTFKYLWSQLLSTTDRQRHVRRASSGIMLLHFGSISWKAVCQKNPTNNRSLKFFFTFFCWELYFLLPPWQAFKESHFFPGGRCCVYLDKCGFFLKGGRRGWHYTCSCCARWRGESPVAPCQAAVSIVLFAYRLAPGTVLSYWENKQLVAACGPSGNLHANQDESLASTTM